MTFDGRNLNRLEEILSSSTGNKELIIPVKNYIDLLILKNQELNLVSRRMTIDELISDHIYDCLAGFKYFSGYVSITDLGTGAGLPGILLALVYPQKKIILIEKSPKKSNFLREAAGKLNLKNAEIINALAADSKIKTESVTCRGFKDINSILSMTEGFLRNNGVYILYKARIDTINEELTAAKERFKFSYSINKIDEIKDKERHIVIIKKA
jgi:16S rRNA (guanine527-N7)-methyltransferase